MRRALLALVLVVGCDDEMPMAPPPPPPAPTTLELAALCESVADAECARLEMCGTLVAPIDLARCKDYERNVRCGPRVDQLSKAIAAGHLSYDATTGLACKDAVAARGCDVPFGRDLFAETSCVEMVTALSGEDGPCSMGAACTEGHYCDVTQARCPGRCRPFRGNNEACGFEDLCGPGLFCSAMGNRCLAQVALGGPCQPSIGSNACQAGSWCDPQPGGATCVAVRGFNTGCTSGFQCAAGLRCIGSICSDGREGGKCTSDFDCQHPLRCNGTGRCRAAIALDAECAAEDRCQLGLTCTSSAGATICRPQPVVGEMCAADDDCFGGGACTNTCAEPIADGAKCAATAECVAGRACADEVCVVPFTCAL